MNNKKILTVIALALLLPVAGLAQNQETKDEIIAKDAFRAIGNHVFYTIFDIVDVDVSDGVVTLSGWVTEPYKKNSFVEKVKEYASFDVEVVDNMKALPVSHMDNRLRAILARSIYGDNRLLRYTITNWPYPVHIIVKNGTVTLEGQVRTMLDSRIIQSKVSEIVGIVSVKNNLKVI